ncbi:hypothetical protein OG194_21655 [Streptomyces sp. NBC_01288]|uniref:hypothetical protein n=1 Tax=Streptomyces sp. NBC_01288 TaxID=2903814 RepID=UPI002E0F0166|nr:hypothetical protein OG194_21655 [Streptomyces sp. NBC_01288]
MRIGITGHRGLSGEVERTVRALIEETVASYTGSGSGSGNASLVGVSCIADGPDAWFAEAVLGHGGRLEVALPAEQYRADLPAWYHPAYDDLLRRATEVHRTGLDASGPDAYMAGSELLVDQVDVLLAVWDGRPARGYGGTADVVSYAREHDVPVKVLWPEGATRG